MVVPLCGTMVGYFVSDGWHSLNADGWRFAPGLGECGKVYGERVLM